MKIISIVILFLFGCGAGAEDVQNLCDGTDDIALGIRVDHFSHHFEGSNGLSVENGAKFIYVNGKCEFWTYGYIPDHVSYNPVLRVDVKTGKLAEDQAIELLNLVSWKDWGDFDQKLGSHSFISKTFRFAVTPHSEVATDSEGVEIADGFYDAIEYLYTIGSPIEGGDVRVYIEPAIEDSWWKVPGSEAFFFKWPLEMNMISELAEMQSPSCFGTSFLVKGTAADLLRDERKKYQKIASKISSPQVGVIDAEGGKHRFYMRDALPIENEFGLVPFNERYGEVSCFYGAGD